MRVRQSMNGVRRKVRGPITKAKNSSCSTLLKVRINDLNYGNHLYYSIIVAPATNYFPTKQRQGSVSSLGLKHDKTPLNIYKLNLYIAKLQSLVEHLK